MPKATGEIGSSRVVSERVSMEQGYYPAISMGNLCSEERLLSLDNNLGNIISRHALGYWPRELKADSACR